MGISVDIISRDIVIGSRVVDWWSNLAVSIVWGLGFSTFMTLILTPAVLSLPYALKNEYKKFFKTEANGIQKIMAKEDKKIDFESSLKELENIVAKLEDENINLEDSVKSFEKGVNLVKECQKQLQTAELKIKKLLDDGSASEIDNE